MKPSASVSLISQCDTAPRPTINLCSETPEGGSEVARNIIVTDACLLQALCSGIISPVKTAGHSPGPGAVARMVNTESVWRDGMST